MTKFTKQTDARVQEDSIVFRMETAGVWRDFEISGDVLRRRFDARDGSPSELLRAFERAAGPLRELAHRAQWVPSDGRIEIGAGDFEER
ncbi:MULTISPECIES: DUF1488 family protein [Bordetella]|uniref:DUF1488 family protein n=1 Tax=Bordetella TaxID=517 RepID=UPI0002FE9657|nr:MULTISPECIES: DUF1488 family protein [Bordetella]KCV24402.1 PF07369 family protein [Bordetella bronchiseptica 00-P-2730]KCV65664.1 PF07369 family protein [Bordetella bronchiseptica 99-R-0433]